MYLRHLRSLIVLRTLSRLKYLRLRNPRPVGALRRKLAQFARPVGALRRKLAHPGGFSLAETLLCCLILALSTATLAQTMGLAGKQFNTRTRESDARILCNTLSQAIQDYLSCATAWEIAGDGTLEFETGAIPSREEPVRCSFGASGSGFLMLNYDGGGQSLALAPEADYMLTNGRPALAASCAVSYDADGGCFTATVRVFPNPRGPLWDAKMQEVQNDFIVIPVPDQSCPRHGESNR